MVLWGHRFPTSTPSRIADCSGLPPMRGLKGLRISFGSFPFRRTQLGYHFQVNQPLHFGRVVCFDVFIDWAVISGELRSQG